MCGVGHHAGAAFVSKDRDLGQLSAAIIPVTAFQQNCTLLFDDADKIFRAVCAGAAGYVLKSAGIDQIGEAIRQVRDGGAPMTPEVARKVLDAFAQIDPPRDHPDDYHLTERELEILRLMADGLLKKEIADRLALSVHTVSTHMRRVYEKLHVGTNTGAVAKALREGII